MATRGDTVNRVGSIADLPRLPAPLPLQLRTDDGNVLGKVLWIDTREMIFWANTRAGAGRELVARMALAEGQVVDLVLRVIDGETPLRYRDGHVHVAGWMGRDESAHGQVSLALRSLNPTAFVPGYRSPRPPRSADRAAAAAAKKAQEAAQLEALRQGFTSQVMEKQRERSRLRRSGWARAGVALLVAAGLGGLAILSLTEFRPARALCFRLIPDVALKYRLLAGPPMPGLNADGVRANGADLHGARLVGASARSAQFVNADLSGADLRRTDLADADLSGAKLAGARLEGANLRGAQLCGADLRGAQLGGARFAGALGCESTRWPDDTPPADLAVPDLAAKGVAPTTRAAPTDGSEATDTTAPEATDTTAPAATNTTAPAATNTTAPAATNTTAPAAPEAAAPATPGAVPPAPAAVPAAPEGR